MSPFHLRYFQCKQELESLMFEGGSDVFTSNRHALHNNEVIRHQCFKKVHPKVRNHGWLKAATTAFTLKTLLRHYAKRALTPRSLNVKLCPRRNYHKGRAAIRHYANQPPVPYDFCVADTISR